MTTGLTHLLPSELASQSVSDTEIVLPFSAAIRALYVLAPVHRVLGWEGWLRLPDGCLTHSMQHQGTADLSSLPSDGAARLCERTITLAQETFDAAPELPGSTLLFCITVK
jgi:hypothetical protein